MNDHGKRQRATKQREIQPGQDVVLPDTHNTPLCLSMGGSQADELYWVKRTLVFDDNGVVVKVDPRPKVPPGSPNLGWTIPSISRWTRRKNARHILYLRDSGAVDQHLVVFPWKGPVTAQQIACHVRDREHAHEIIRRGNLVECYQDLFGAQILVSLGDLKQYGGGQSESELRKDVENAPMKDLSKYALQLARDISEHCPAFSGSTHSYVPRLLEFAKLLENGRRPHSPFVDTLVSAKFLINEWIRD